ncbi:MAG TPA: NfeD family protein [Acidimicrobiales bacterium]|nr:NfeD family protein [Acidimicrobiales bacterium]
MRRVVGALLAAIALLLLAVPARAKDERRSVRVIQIGGLLDRVQADFWQHAIRDADDEKAAALIVQLDSARSVLSAQHDSRLVSSVAAAKTPIAVWVGPARAGFAGADLAEVVRVADVLGLAPGAHTGFRQRVDLRAPTLGDFLVRLDGRAGISVPTKRVRAGGVARREPLVTVRFSKPSLTARALHGVTSPGPAYALLVFGLLLALLEFATAGVGLAAATAAIFLALAALGLGGLPVQAPAVGAIAFAALGFGIDAQAGAPRAWTAIGAGSLLYGSFFLFDDGMSVPRLWIVAVLGLSAALVLTGLPSLVRARFSSPTIGRDGFVGEAGVAIGALSPDGVVEVRGGTWRARTNRATPIEDGDEVRVIGIDGLVLDVEPVEGGAKDYRERSKSST